MNFTCDNCQRRYSIADEKVRGKTVKVRCKNCQNVISVQGPPAEMEESTRVVSLADVAKIREQELALQAAQPAAKAPAGQSPWEEEPTRAAPARPASAPWYVMVKSKQEGPLDEAGLRALMQSGAINARSFFWQQGMGDWKRGADIAELSGLFAAPAAPPPPAPPAAPMLPDEPATVADRGQHHRGAQASNPRMQRAPEPEQDNAWDDQPTTVGPAAKLPAAREPWDLDPPGGQQQAQQQESWDQPQAQQDQAWDDQQQQYADPQQQDQAWDDQQQQQQYADPQQDADQQQDQDQAWDDQQQQQQQRAAGGNGQAGVGADLFSDLDLPDKNEQDGQPDQQTGLEAEQPDPLAGVKGKPGKDKKPVEDTRHFMVKSGVTRRNPFWKIALFILLPILLIAGGAFALDRLNFIPKAKVVNAQGQTVEKSYFSEEGVGELRDRMLGRKKPTPTAPAPTPAPAPAPKTPSDTAPKPGGQGGETPAAPETGKSAEELKALYGDSAKTDVGPEARKDTEEVPVDAVATGGPPEEDVAKVVAQSQGAIKGCVEQELRKNPKFKGGKVTLVATVGTSGTVKSAKLDNKALDTSPVGTCIKKAASRMAFPAFKAEDGVEEVDLQIPLVLGSGAL